MTRTGRAVQVTDHGEPLWILQPANGTYADEAERRRAIDEILDEVLREKPSKVSAAPFPAATVNTSRALGTPRWRASNIWLTAGLCST